MKLEIQLEEPTKSEERTPKEMEKPAEDILTREVQTKPKLDKLVCT